MCSSPVDGLSDVRDAVCIDYVGLRVSFAPLVSEAVGTLKEHSQPVAHLPVHHVGNCKGALD